MMQFEFEPSGKLKYPTDDMLAEADKDTVIITYTDGTTADGKPFYAYVAIPPSRYKEFHELSLARSTVAIADYGTIIMSGFERKPSPAVVREMREKYGFDENYAGKVVAAAKKQQVEFIKKQEDSRLANIVAMLKKDSKKEGN